MTQTCKVCAVICSANKQLCLILLKKLEMQSSIPKHLVVNRWKVLISRCQATMTRNCVLNLITCETQLTLCFCVKEITSKSSIMLTEWVVCSMMFSVDNITLTQQASSERYQEWGLVCLLTLAFAFCGLSQCHLLGNGPGFSHSFHAAWLRLLPFAGLQHPVFANVQAKQGCGEVWS